MSFAFTQENLEKIEALKRRYPSPRALTLPCLWIAQEQEGFIALDAVDEIARVTTWAPMEVYRTATFYTMFNLEPVGKYHIQLCKTLSCKLCGGGEILKAIEESLGIKPGETTEDGRFTLSLVECLGSCGTGPMMQINATNYENLDPPKVQAILKELE